MIYSHEILFLSEISCIAGLLIIDRFGCADCDKAFTQAIYIDIENGGSRDVLSDLQTSKFATDASGIIRIHFILHDVGGVTKFSIVHPYKEERDHFWHQKRRRIKLENRIVNLRTEVELLKERMSKICIICPSLRKVN